MRPKQTNYTSLFFFVTKIHKYGIIENDNIMIRLFTPLAYLLSGYKVTYIPDCFVDNTIKDLLFCAVINIFPKDNILFCTNKFTGKFVWY